jgi:hypothetical protein
MKSKRKARRAGATETFSVSVDPETKRALRALADEEYGGNLSALVTDFAAEARRRKAAGAFLRLQGAPLLSETEAHALASAIADEVAAVRRRRKRPAA